MAWIRTIPENEAAGKLKAKIIAKACKLALLHDRWQVRQ